MFEKTLKDRIEIRKGQTLENLECRKMQTIRDIEQILTKQGKETEMTLVLIDCTIAYLTCLRSKGGSYAINSFTYIFQAVMLKEKKDIKDTYKYLNSKGIFLPMEIDRKYYLEV